MRGHSKWPALAGRGWGRRKGKKERSLEEKGMGEGVQNRGREEKEEDEEGFRQAPEKKETGHGFVGQERMRKEQSKRLQVLSDKRKTGKKKEGEEEDGRDISDTKGGIGSREVKGGRWEEVRSNSNIMEGRCFQGRGRRERRNAGEL